MRQLSLMILLLASFTLPAVGCPSGQHEECLSALGRKIACGCVWNSPGDFAENAGEQALGLAEAAADAGDLVLKQAAQNVIEVVNTVGQEARAAIDHALKSGDKAVSDAARNLMKSANDAIDAAKAAERYAERQVQGYRDVLSNAEKRIREGKVADAIWHLGTEPLQNTNKNLAKLAKENELIAQAAQAAIVSAAGPAGAAAYASWKAYNDSGGNVEVALKAGAYAYAVSAGYGNVDALPAGTPGEIAKKAAATGAIAGLGVAASGGSSQDVINAFIKSGGGVVVQSGQAYVQNNYVDPIAKDSDSYCITISGSDCADAKAWYDKSKKFTQDAEKVMGEAATIRVTPDGKWAIGWSKSAIQNPERGVPGVVLTYIGPGSPYDKKLKEIVRLAHFGPPADSPWINYVNKALGVQEYTSWEGVELSNPKCFYLAVSPDKVLGPPTRQCSMPINKPRMLFGAIAATHVAFIIDAGEKAKKVRIKPLERGDYWTIYRLLDKVTKYGPIHISDRRPDVGEQVFAFKTPWDLPNTRCKVIETRASDFSYNCEGWEPNDGKYVFSNKDGLLLGVYSWHVGELLEEPPRVSYAEYAAELKKLSKVLRSLP